MEIHSFKASHYEFSVKDKDFKTKISENKLYIVNIAKKICAYINDYAKNKFSKLNDIF